MLLDVETWIAITSALVVAFSPIYWVGLKLEKNIATLTAIVDGCPYCTRRFEKEVKRK